MPRTFKEPVDWGFVPGPTFVESIGGALAAVDLWLKHTASDERVAPERMMAFDLRQRLAAVPQVPTAFQVEEIMTAIRTVVDFAVKRKVVLLSDQAGS
ncbi:hypothetical protein [Reyranella sp. CPCC 100927]|uniref:hypothetical protein n=1 Tax=Reyranella sp. CPCC 100927 TaxID=2599616 RepID=UPI0011B4FCF6|nr:hypothetical protein [Reyranella sp. CPCC 100927]TWT13840.1 hypothetical protein FQU96_08000 [Reyranella sp. CPCC 100927]